MQYIKLVFESLCRALIRFFDNRSIKDDSVEWYRMELDRRSKETQRIIDQLLLPRTIIPEVEEEQEWKPINKSKFQSWETKRRELENESRLRAAKLVDEARTAIAAKKTTAELEAELLNG